MIYGKEMWGPKAWHLLHAFSINNNSGKKKHNYYIFYTTFAYIIPCIKCSDHYSNIIYYKIPIIEEHIDKTYLKKWVYSIHNEVNSILNKTKYKYEIYCNDCNKINNEDIYFFINTVYQNLEYDTMSLYNYDQIYNFFINFCKLYPDRKRRIRLKELINNTEFKEIYTPKQFMNWFIKNNKLFETIFHNDK